MNAQDITKALGGHWHGSYGTARCPAHEDKTPSLSVRDAEGDKLLTHCFSGCSPAAVWGALQDSGLVERAEDRPAHRHRHRRQRRPPPSRAAQPATGTLAEDYLRGRGITIPIPPSIRYHPGLKHADTGLNMPCLVAAVCNVDRQITGIQRIYLTHDGRKAPVNLPKMALGTLRGGAVRLAPTTDRVWLTEGVEDALAVVQMMQEPAWAVLGTSNFKTVELPENIRQVILAPDGDDAGQGVIQETATRLAGQGREVRAAKLPAGKDWCDVLDDYEERAGILEFEMELSRPDAEKKARQETIDG
jgi:hypothetical protein